MGWKLLKEKYQIKHQVAVLSNGIVVIGSPYVHNLITINPETGEITENSTFRGFGNEVYPNLMNASCAEIVETIKANDKFERSIPVYTCLNGEIIEKQCEEYGWPNATHDGCVMYENTFYGDRKGAIKSGIVDARIGVKWAKENIERLEKELEDEKIRLETEARYLRQLSAELEAES